MTTGSPLRIGIVASGTVVPAWQAEVLRNLTKGLEVHLAVFVATGAPASQPSAPWPGSLVIERHFRKATYAHLNPTDIAPFLVGTVLVRDGDEREQDRALRQADLDVLLLLDGTAVRHRTGVAAQGTWWFRHPSAPQWTGLPAGLLERILGLTLSHVQLVRGGSATNGTEVEVLQECAFRSQDNDPEIKADAIFSGVAAWPAQLFHRHGAIPPALSDDQQGSITMELPAPGTWETLRALFQGLGPHSAKATGQSEWNIGVLPQGADNLLEDRPSLNVRWLPPPNTGSHRSEPFGYIDRSGELNVIYRKDVPDGPSRFARVRPKADNILKRSREFLQLGSSLSYPYVVEHEGEVYVVVSRTDDRVTELHRLEETNTGLTPDRILLHEALEAPTLYMHDGRWWLMGSRAPLGSESLYLYSSDRLGGPYLPHPMNPVRMDARGARPAGTPFVHNGVLWRPGLDCTDAAHPRVVLHEVLQLDGKDFLERPRKVIGPFKGSVYPEGIRTICSMGEITLVDGLRRLSSDQLAASDRRKRERSKERSRKR
jgi:hypothetical protein